MCSSTTVAGVLTSFFSVCFLLSQLMSLRVLQLTIITMIARLSVTVFLVVLFSGQCVDGSHYIGQFRQGHNSLDFCPALWKSLGCFHFQMRTFFTVEGGDTEFANFTLPSLKTFLEDHSQNVSGNKQ